MTTTTKAPATAVEAQALADQLRERESNLRRRQTEASRQARITAAHHELERADALATARDQALIALREATADPAVGLNELFEKFQAARIASVQRARHVAQASGVLDRLAPKRSEISGQAVAWRSDVHDGLDALGDFTTVIAGALRQRTDAAGLTATNAVQSAVDAAGAAASAATQ